MRALYKSKFNIRKKKSLLSSYRALLMRIKLKEARATPCSVSKMILSFQRSQKPHRGTGEMKGAPLVLFEMNAIFEKKHL